MRLILVFHCAVVALLVAIPTAATTWHVPADAPTIQAGIDSASTGDDVLVAPGIYFEHDIVMKPGTTVHSEQGPDVTTLDAGAAGVGFICTNLEERATIEGFTVLNGLAEGIDQNSLSGGGVKCVGSSLLIRDCTITECVASDRGGGIYALDSELEIDACRVVGCSAHQGGGIVVFNFDMSTARIANCEILDNRTVLTCGGVAALAQELTIVGCVVSGNGATWGGVGGIGCRSPMFTIRDCIVVDNWVGATAGGTSGIYVDEESTGIISGSTVARNEGPGSSGAICAAYFAELQVDRSIMAFNYCGALSCRYGAQVAVTCCDTFGNSHGNDLCGDDLGGNFSADPLFCDPENGDFTLDCDSPCLPGNHPDGADCGLIGALDMGCGATPILESTWGRIKSSFQSR